jgi:hypothetical protein
VPVELTEAAFAPLGHDFDTYRPLLLTCRHYLGFDEETGEARIIAMRLIDLKVESFPEFQQKRRAS